MVESGREGGREERMEGRKGEEGIDEAATLTHTHPMMIICALPTERLKYQHSIIICNSLSNSI